MVSIIPQESSLDLVGKMMGQQIGNNLPGAVQQGYQRGQGLNAIDQLQTDLAAAKGDLTKMIPAIAKAYTLNPALERSGIAEKLIPLAQRNQGTGEFPVGQGQARGPTKQGEKGQEVVSVSDIVNPRETMIKNPQGVTDFQLPYGPDEIANIRQQARQRGYTPEMEERYVQDALEYNKVAEQKRAHDIANYNQQQQERRDITEAQSNFANYMKNNAKEFWDNPDERELALQEANKILSDPKKRSTSLTDVLAQVKEKLRPYQAEKQALGKSLKRPLFGRTQNQKDLEQKRAQRMIDMGQKPQLQLMIAQGGNGEVEEAELINPLSESFEKNFNKFGKFVQPLDFVKNADPDSPEYNKQIQEGQKRLDSQKGHISDFLSNHITTGDYNNPGTNLLLIRKNLMDKGLEWDEAGKVIDMSIEKGKIKLDPQQLIDHQKLAYPPLTADSYFDTIMNNFMFPITGKQ